MGCRQRLGSGENWRGRLFRGNNLNGCLKGERTRSELAPESTLVLLIRLVVTAVVAGDKGVIGNGIESHLATGSGLFKLCMHCSMNRS